MTDDHILIREYHPATKALRAEYVMRYTRGDMAEVFTMEERVKLAAGEVLIRESRFGHSHHVDMLAAARAKFGE